MPASLASSEGHRLWLNLAQAVSRDNSISCQGGHLWCPTQLWQTPPPLLKKLLKVSQGHPSVKTIYLKISKPEGIGKQNKWGSVTQCGIPSERQIQSNLETGRVGLLTPSRCCTLELWVLRK